MVRKNSLEGMENKFNNKEPMPKRLFSVAIPSRVVGSFSFLGEGVCNRI